MYLVKQGGTFVTVSKIAKRNEETIPNEQGQLIAQLEEAKAQENPNEQTINSLVEQLKNLSSVIKNSYRSVVYVNHDPFSIPPVGLKLLNIEV